MAYGFLRSIGWAEADARHVKDCISSHRYRGDNAPQSIEAKILFDADKLEAAGVVGIARTLVYKGQVVEPLYTVDATGTVLDGTGKEAPSFFREYNYKLKRVYERFFTARGAELAKLRRPAAEYFYQSLLDEVRTVAEAGREALGKYLA